MRRVYYALFAAAALAVSIGLVVHYDVLTLARAFVVPAWRWLVLTGRLISGPLWQGLTVAARPLAKNYLMRRLEAPLWRILTQAALLLVGFGAIAKLSARMRSGGTYLRRGVVWWKARHRVLRWGVASGLVFGAGFLGFGMYIMPVWIPISGRILQSLHFWWADRFVNRWIAPAQARFRRLMRTNPFWRTARRPYRILLYWLAFGTRRGVRWLRRSFTVALAPRHAPQP
jgi:hypothetical protein